jgi:hypothetical protein
VITLVLDLQTTHCRVISSNKNNYHNPIVYEDIHNDQEKALNNPEYQQDCKFQYSQGTRRGVVVCFVHGSKISYLYESY